MSSDLRRELRAALERAAQPGKAAGMQAYMKSAMPYLGVPAVPFRAVCKQVFAGRTFPTADWWRTAVLDLWRGATYREER